MFTSIVKPNVINSMSQSIAKQIQAVQRAKQLMEVKEMSLIEKAMKSQSPSDILAAVATLNETMEPKDDIPSKAYFIDPLEFQQSLGYKEKPWQLTYTTLARMSRTPIINSIIKTRKNQVADFAEPQIDRYSTGFAIRRKAKMGVEQKMDSKDKKMANFITDFLLNGGVRGTWEADDFDTFTRKVMQDSLSYDQLTWENIRNKKGQLDKFIATDASTFRFAESYYKDDYDNPNFQNRSIFVNSRNMTKSKEIMGFDPFYVQIYQGHKVAEFYPWELCFGIRNPSTSIHSNGYGISELEDLINIVTSLLWSDEYNRRFFSQGSAPKGLLRFKGPVNEASLQQFRQQWQAMISGVMQSWKTPVVQGEVDWIDLQKNNRDMEFSSWQEYLIKLACACYSIDPSEIGFDISRSSSGNSLFQGSQEERLQHSKDKGLYPLLKFYQRKLNKYIVEQIDPDFELVFLGLNGMTIGEELEMDIKKANNFMTVNETREKWELPEIEGGDIILHSVFTTALNAERQAAAGGFGNSADSVSTDGVLSEEVEEQNPFDFFVQEDADDTGASVDKAEDENLFVKAFNNFLVEEENGIRP